MRSECLRHYLHIGCQRPSRMAQRDATDVSSRCTVDVGGRQTVHRCTRGNEWFRLMPEEWGFARCPATRAASDRQEVARARVRRRMAQLRHRPRFDLADALPREVEVLADLFQRARLPPIEAEAQL